VSVESPCDRSILAPIRSRNDRCSNERSRVPPRSGFLNCARYLAVAGDFSASDHWIIRFRHSHNYSRAAGSRGDFNSRSSRTAAKRTRKEAARGGGGEEGGRPSFIRRRGAGLTGRKHVGDSAFERCPANEEHARIDPLADIIFRNWVNSPSSPPLSLSLSPALLPLFRGAFMRAPPSSPSQTAAI
jgi:hypothetical protein